MTHALTLLIASSVGWTAPEARPSRAELDLIIATVETAVIDAAAPEAAPTAAESPAPAAQTAPGALVNDLGPASHDARPLITYDRALPWFRTKP
jgi:hypothetical protein